jgi:serine/threonine-protein kinase
MPDPSDRTCRLQFLGEIAQGGMGAVLKGRDVDIGRDLAVKVILERFANNPDMLRRFVEEAQITGQLQHPGVVPVHEMGTLADHRPYFTMKLVKGRTLSKILGERPDPAIDQPRLISIFLHIAQTVAYAHARGVIHRDLKPSNVMVGSFGEVQVMDWGLAKVLARGGASEDGAGRVPIEETVIATARSGSDSDLSRAGSVMGTPSYMAPEQARGEELDERADVFALGSILCEILTGHPAFTGRSAVQVQYQASRCLLDDTLDRLERCRADAELVALARDSLKPEPEDRPRNAGIVAERLIAHLSGVQERLRASEIAQAAEVARAEEAKRTAEEARRAAEESRRAATAAEAQARAERRARRSTLALAASVLALVGLGLGGYAWTNHQKTERVARASKAVEEALAEGSRLRDKALGDLTRWGEAVAATERAGVLAEQGEVALSLRNRAAELSAQVGRERATAEARARRVKADHDLLVRLESIWGDHGEHNDAKRTDEAYAAAFREAGLDLDATDPAEAGRWIAERSDPMEAVAYLDHWASVRRVAKQPEASCRRPIEAARAADRDPWRDGLRRLASTDSEERNEALRRLADDSPALGGQPAPNLVLLAREFKYNLKDVERAEKVLLTAASLYPGDFRVRIDLAKARGVEHGLAREIYPRPEEAIRNLTAATAIRPKSCVAHSNLGSALWAAGRNEEAAAEHRLAIQIGPDASYHHNNLGNALSDQGKYEEAVEEFRRALRLDPDQIFAHDNLGIALRGLGRYPEAAEEHKYDIRRNPKDATFHYHLGFTLHFQDKYEEAIGEYREALRLRPDYFEAHKDLGVSLAALGRYEEACREQREAIRLKPDYLEAHASLGLSLIQMGKHEEGEAELRQLLLSKGDKTLLAAARAGLVLAKFARGQQSEAEQELREAIRLNPDHALAHAIFGCLLELQGRHEEAIAEFRRAPKISPDFAVAHYHHGVALSGLSRFAEADVELRKALRLNPEYAEAHNALGLALSSLGKLDEAAEAFRRAARIQPSNADYQNRLGLVLQGQNKHEEADKAFREVIRLNPGFALAYVNLAANLAATGRLREAESKYREAIRLDPKNSATRFAFADFLIRVAKYGEALAEYQAVAKDFPPDSPEGKQIADRVRYVERQGSLAQRLPSVLRGIDAPAGASELLEFSDVCICQARYSEAVRFISKALAAEPGLLEDRNQQPRYNGACAAALVASGRDRYETSPGEVARASMRKQAFAWLRGELDEWAKFLESGPAGERKAVVARTLNHWKGDSDLEVIREPAQLARHPEAERKDWQALWARVDALILKAEGEEPKPSSSAEAPG